ncbi:hypothetical protein AVEN_38839-1, partial [Araneus ventricosus]
WFDENTKGIDTNQNSNQYPKFNFTISDYSDDKDYSDDLDTVIDSLSGRLIPETSSESPSTSREEPKASTISSLIPCSEIKKNTKSEKLPNSTKGQQEANVVEVRIPTCYQQAIRSREASKGCDVMDREINIMIEHKVKDLIDAPENVNVLGNCWVYILKHDENNRALRFKACLVAQGNTQLKGESSDEVFSAVINFSIVRLFFQYLCMFMKMDSCSSRYK